MSAFVGRTAVLSMGSPLVAVAACRAKSVTLANEPIDFTSDDDSGFRALLAAPGTKTLDISFEGVAKGIPGFRTLITQIMNGTTIHQNVSILFPGVGTFAGTFAFTNFEMGAPYNEATTFSASLQSAGSFTFTPAT